jgi:thiol-disulfide isomerase/thioredoxin
MKRILSALLITALCVTHLFSQDNVTKEIYKLYREEKFTEALKAADKVIKAQGENEQILQAKFYVLKALKNDEEAREIASKRLALVNDKIKEEGENSRSLGLKFGLLKELGRTDEALVAAIRGDKLAEKKRPWGCIDIAALYLEKENKDNALDWLEEAVDRGYISYQEFLEEDYKPLHNEKRFKKLIQTIKKNIGIGKPAKDFTLETLSGGTFTLSKYKGKVVLVDFWATWCGPCRDEMPNVKNIYSKYKDQGFEIIGISLDNKKEDLESYIKDEELGWKFSYSGKGWQDETAAAWGVNSIPSMWLVDRKGKLQHFGMREDALVKAVEELVSK